MERMSARFVGRKLGLSAERVYSIWEGMGLVIKDNFGGWDLTEVGRNIGGRMSKSNHRPVPTFDFEVVEKMMLDYYNKHRK